ncbi:MAG: hypothetical protein A3I68_01315 [Candidatus Melainabacteria bacterium RIFCSPLOWO2_02_FULL_35_15]|nr:MAG: hypothetical protein A3I68_01315 [Candidatus Melainabacteria bacterium RIFCSPLOWO2_02_FULL_35_15]
MPEIFIKLFFHYSHDIVPAFLFALLVSAILAEIIPENFFERVIGSNHFISVFLASIIGALIPLCTCGMIPLASKLQKKGTSWPIAASFLTAGNASSITAIILTLVLGMKIALFRFLFAVIFGTLVSYIFVLFFKPNSLNPISAMDICHDKPLYKKIISEFVSLLFSFGPWVLLSIIIAASISLFLKPDYVAEFAGAGNILSPFLLSVSGFPFYFCGGSDIPISKALLEKGASLGSVLAFMTASPGVNLTSFLVYQKWLGAKNAVIYLTISFLVCGFLGLIINFLQ